MENESNFSQDRIKLLVNGEERNDILIALFEKKKKEFTDKIIVLEKVINSTNILLENFNVKLGNNELTKKNLQEFLSDEDITCLAKAGNKLVRHLNSIIRNTLRQERQSKENFPKLQVATNELIEKIRVIANIYYFSKNEL